MKLPVLTLMASLVGGTACAATTGFSITINGDNNVPTLLLTNTGDSGDITGFNLNIGDTDYNFDGIEGAVPNGLDTVNLTSGDTNLSGGIRVDTLSFATSGFDSGDSYQFAFDVDIDNSNTLENYQTSALPGGAFEVFFANGLTDSLLVDLTPTADNASEPYAYAASVTDDMAPVPLPAGLPLLLAGLGALGILRSRR